MDKQIDSLNTFVGKSKGTEKQGDTEISLEESKIEYSEPGFIKIHRRLIWWEWYSDINVRATFFHLLLIANWKEKRWKGHIVKRGQVIVGRKKLSTEVGISERKLRTALSKLISTNEIAIKTTNKFTLVTIVNYNKYQDAKLKEPSKLTSNQPSTDHQLTTTKEYKERKEYKDIPTLKQFLLYAKDKDSDFAIKKKNLTMKYEAWKENGWKDGNGKKIKNWKTKLLNTLPHIPKEYKKQSHRL